MLRVWGMVLVGVLVTAMGAGCRDWRGEKSEYRDKRSKAGTLIGSSQQDVIKELGVPTLKWTTGENEIYEYAFKRGELYNVDAMGLDKPNSARVDPPGEIVETDSFRVYFKEGKMIAAEGL